jgi:hypothetical protein
LNAEAIYFIFLTFAMLFCNQALCVMTMLDLDLLDCGFRDDGAWKAKA